MSDNLTGGLRRLEADGAQQFTMAATPSIPTTVSFLLLNIDGSSLDLSSISPVNAGQVAQHSLNSFGSGTGLFHIEFVLPATPGFYTAAWYAFDSSSRPGILREEFEVIRSEPYSFFSYGILANVYRSARHLFGAANITPRDASDYMLAAHNEMNSILALQFTTPISPVPPKLQDIEKNIALYGIYASRFATNKEDPPTGLKELRDADIEFLSSVVSGTTLLEVSSGNLLRAKFDIESTTQNFKPVFDVREWTEMKVDPDLLAQDAGNAGDAEEDA